MSNGNPPVPGIKGGILVIGAWAYGYGIDLAQAKAFFTSKGARLSDGYHILTFDNESEFTGVDGFGRVHYNGNRPTLTIVKPRNRK